MKASKHRRGFTLVELLVVITIIGMLMALLLPAVQAAREAGRRATCMNNQKNVTLALLQHESSRGGLPGYMNEVGKSQLSSTRGYPVFGTWVVALFPYMDRADLQDLWSRGVHRDYSSTSDAPGYVNLDLLLCPSQPDQQGQMPCSYRVNGGRVSITAGAETSFAHNVSPPTDSTAIGLFDVQAPYFTVPMPPQPALLKSVKLSQGAIRDGATTTLILAENTQQSSWTLEPPPTQDPTTFWNALYPTSADLPRETYLAFGVPQVADTNQYPAHGMEFINVNFDDPGRGIVPASYHTGLVIVSFADGHQYALNEDVNIFTYLHLLTPHGKQAYRDGVKYSWPFFNNSNWANTVLDEADY